ncbi:hypothetical protein PanWU01x14_049620 [Parasponia andersonii]|uniref:Uncharacterized protein n=1 Tax=Parasponia andersonii TaxID=3476 RepID=A0A2P5DMN4_PARAD|nr:hypothetical protein PanWU01x14_049620 [Parasponia andersonii]
MAIQAGKLKEYLKMGRSQSKEDAARPKKRKQTRADPGSGGERKIPKKDRRKGEVCEGDGHSVNHLTMEESYTSATLIAFTQQDLATVGLLHDDPLVIKLQIDSALVGRVLVDGESSVDVLTKVSLLGVVTLKVCAAERCLDVDFVIIDYQSSFNIIMGRGWIHAIHGIATTFHQVLSCLSKDSTYTIDIRRDQASAKKYFSTALGEADASASTGDK